MGKKSRARRKEAGKLAARRERVMLFSTVGALVVAIAALGFSVAAYLYDGERARPELSVVGVAEVAMEVYRPSEEPEIIAPAFTLYVVTNSGGEPVTITNLMATQFATQGPEYTTWIGQDCDASDRYEPLGPNQARVYMILSGFMTTRDEPTELAAFDTDGGVSFLDVPVGDLAASNTGWSYVDAGEALLRACGGGLLPAVGAKWGLVRTDID